MSERRIVIFTAWIAQLNGGKALVMLYFSIRRLLASDGSFQISKKALSIPGGLG